ncbi:hypothetical protein DPMN_129924 [Dreissena polymorpha]|uniref:Uncharacterized protein n=1 Tax=Dreissena polymorpha TaxID=45954 RepID=A0A9D4K0Z5_DREPO|nr:hypothetical protein DPMN_129924 [Dreissena polymorpha]
MAFVLIGQSGTFKEVGVRVFCVQACVNGDDNVFEYPVLHGRLQQTTEVDQAVMVTQKHVH